MKRIVIIEVVHKVTKTYSHLSSIVKISIFKINTNYNIKYIYYTVLNCGIDHISVSID